MEFSNLFFLYLFLPVTAGIYFLAPGMRLKNGVLILFSLLFYCFSRPAYVPLMVGLVVVNYYIPKVMKYRRASMFLVLGIDLGTLMFFKVIADIPFPLGISFYLFSLISYQADRYRNPETEADRFWQFFLFVSFFPKMVMGPIVRYSELLPQLRERQTDPEKIFRGVFRFAVGLGKKVLLADPLFRVYEQLGSHSSWVAPWAGGLAFMLYIFFEFSGYGDMALGMGQMFGSSLPENFRRPYTAVSVRDFWRRWHITLGAFFRGYVYIPLGGKRKGLLRQICNLFLVWLLTGLWHGINGTFVLWGMYFFLLIVTEQLLPMGENKGLRILSRGTTFLLIYFGWVIFAAEDLPALAGTLSRMVSFSVGGIEPTLLVLRNSLPLLVLGILLAIPGPVWTKKLRLRSKRRTLTVQKYHVLLQTLLLIGILALCTAALMGTASKPSMYAGF